MKPNYPGLAPRSSRRSVMKGAIAGVTGLAAVGAIVAGGTVVAQHNQNGDAHAQYAGSYDNRNDMDSIQTIINVAVTAELLAVTFYRTGLEHSDRLGLGESARLDIKAALIEEQGHANALMKMRARPLTTKFSFPFGNETFTRFENFIKVQQQLEILFVAAYIAAGREFAEWRRPDLVQIAAQIGTVEAEHRAIGRAIGGMRPANNHIFSPVLLKKVGDAPAVLKKDGYLNPRNGNHYEYNSISMDMDGMSNRSSSEQTWY